MGELLQFFVSFEIKEEYGTNVENKIQIASGVIGDKAKYKFRVVGEAKIIASIPRDRFDMLWSRATQSMIHQLQQGQIGIEIFKVLGEKRLHGFTCKQPSVDWEAHLWNFQAEDKIYKSAKLVTKI
ncbi:uncharacterized protein LOC143055362 isoform X3 [Mytilus galloprovincialis]|uniref:uncharacterized protein LOC143055362 isoform X3 n=1 Tax=Mytilus galloprovincialis TaxID=29158 RepID=UPI003F7C71C4